MFARKSFALFAEEPGTGTSLEPPSVSPPELALLPIKGPLRSRIPFAVSVILHTGFAAAAIFAPSPSSAGLSEEVRQRPEVIHLVNIYPALPRRHLQNPQPGTRPSDLSVSQGVEPPNIRPARVETGAFDRAISQQRPASVYAGSGEVVIGALNTVGKADGQPSSPGTVGPVGAFDTFGAATNKSASITMPELLSVPLPPYTEEAKRLNVTGKIVLEVTLAVSGEVRFLRIVSGLGHGLDQAAIEAVNHARCRPATRAGLPVAMVGTITVTFKLI